MTRAQALETLGTMTDADFPTVDSAADLTDDDIEQLVANGRRAEGADQVGSPAGPG